MHILCASVCVRSCTQLMGSGHNGNLSFQEDNKFLLNNLLCGCDGYYNRLKRTAGYINNYGIMEVLDKEILISRPMFS